jgi:hypothetical protein
MRPRTLILIAASMIGLLAGPVGPALAGPDTGAPAAAPPAEACALLGTVAATAGTVSDTVEAQAGQQLPVDLAATVGEIAAQAGCGGGDAPPAPGGTPGLPPEACALLGTVRSAAASIQETVEAQAGQSLPVDLAGTIAQIAAQAGCASAPPPPAPPGGGGPGVPAEVCDLLGTVASGARTLQATIEAQAGQRLPVNLADTLAEVATQAGCSGNDAPPPPGAPTPPGGGTTPALPAEACGVLATLGSTAATVQTTVEAQSGQSLPVSLSGTLAEVATQAGCAAAVAPAPDPGSGKDDKQSPPPSGGSETPRSGSTEVKGTSTTRDATLPSTGGVVLFQIVGGASLGLAGLLEALRRKAVAGR